MRYWWDKIKVVPDNLEKWDNLQVLWFDRCGYLLIWKWNNEYWTLWDPLLAETDECYDAWDCPNCQEKITDVANLPWRPNPCSWWDAFVMMASNWTLKTLCKSEFKCDDKYVAISSWDEEPGYLKDKLLVCDSNWPITLTENTSWTFHTMCIWWDPTKTWLKFKDLVDTPNSYPNPGLLVTNWSWVTVLTPDSCEDSQYSYVVYDKEANAFDTICAYNNSFASWRFDWWSCEVPMDDEWVRIYATNHNDDSAWRIFNGSWHLSCTDDIIEWSWSTLFMLTRPWLYVITCNSTLRNITEAWLQAARWWLLITNWWQSEIEWTDFKYDWRRYTEYVNDFRPQTFNSNYEWSERNLELSIMSFNTTHTIVFDWISASNPIWIWFRVRCSTFLNDHRMDWMTNLESIVLELTWWQTSIWPKTQITCVRVSDKPTSYKYRF